MSPILPRVTGMEKSEKEGGREKQREGKLI